MHREHCALQHGRAFASAQFLSLVVVGTPVVAVHISLCHGTLGCHCTYPAITALWHCLRKMPKNKSFLAQKLCVQPLVLATNSQSQAPHPFLSLSSPCISLRRLLVVILPAHPLCYAFPLLWFAVACSLHQTAWLAVGSHSRPREAALCSTATKRSACATTLLSWHVLGCFWDGHIRS